MHNDCTHNMLHRMSPRWYLLGSSGQAERGRSSSFSTLQHLEFGRWWGSLWNGHLFSFLTEENTLNCQNEYNAPPLSNPKGQFCLDCVAGGGSQWACHQDICSAKAREASQTECSHFSDANFLSTGSLWKWRWSREGQRMWQFHCLRRKMGRV